MCKSRVVNGAAEATLFDASSLHADTVADNIRLLCAILANICTYCEHKESEHCSALNCCAHCKIFEKLSHLLLV